MDISLRGLSATFFAILRKSTGSCRSSMVVSTEQTGALYFFLIDFGFLCGCFAKHDQARLDKLAGVVGLISLLGFLWHSTLGLS